MKTAAANDDEYQDLKAIILNGFPNERANLPLHLRLYWSMRDRLAVDDDFIVCGKRTVIPKLLRKTILERLKNGHMGSSKTKERARQVVWWPQIDNDIEQAVKQCKVCQDNLPRQCKEPMVRRDSPMRAFQQLHLDFSEYAGCKYLTAVDGYSGYPCMVNCGKTAPSSALINGLRRIFIQTAIPEIIWSDGGPQFTAKAFKTFLQRWGVKHITSSPEYAQSNGRAEACVKNIKKMLRGATHQGRVDQDALLEALLLYKNTPLHDGRIPSVLVFGAPIKDTLPAHRRNFSAAWQQKVTEIDSAGSAVTQKVQLRYNRQARSLKRLRTGQPVAIYNHSNRSWDRYGIIVECMRNRDYIIKLPSGRVLRRNRRLLRPREAPSFPTHATPTEDEVAAMPQAGRALRNRLLIKAPKRLIEEI